MIDINFSINPQEMIKSYKEKGWKIIGHFCSYMPEELFYAAGIVPVRIFPKSSDRFDLADEYLPAYTCSFARASLNDLLSDSYSYFDGFFFSSNCDTIRCLFHHFKRHVRDTFIPSMNMPAKARSKAAWVFLKQELDMLKGSIESYTRRIIEKEDLSNAIRIYQVNRKMMLAINQLRISVSGRISARTMNSLYRLNTQLEKQQANDMLERFIGECKVNHTDTMDEGRPKVFVMGNCCGNNEVLELIESCGIDIVDDLLASGAKQFHEAGQICDSDYIGFIASRLNQRLVCPTKILASSKDRAHSLKTIKSQVELSGADGVILLHQKFCDPHGLDRPHLLSELKKSEIPLLELESEQDTHNREQLKTRIEAFIEMIE